MKSKPARRSGDTDQHSREMPSSKAQDKSKFQEARSDRNAAYPQNDDEKLQRKHLAQDNYNKSKDEEDSSESDQEKKSLSKDPKEALRSRAQGRALSLANALANEHERRSRMKK